MRLTYFTFVYRSYHLGHRRKKETFVCCTLECLGRRDVKPEIHGYTGCKRTGFVKPDSMKLAKGHLLHDEAGPWNRALQPPVPPWIQGLVRRLSGGAWLLALSLPLQSPFTWPSLQYPLFKLLQLFACKAHDLHNFFLWHLQCMYMVLRPWVDLINCSLNQSERLPTPPFDWGKLVYSVANQNPRLMRCALSK